MSARAAIVEARGLAKVYPMPAGPVKTSCAVHVLPISVLRETKMWLKAVMVAFWIPGSPAA